MDACPLEEHSIHLDFYNMCALLISISDHVHSTSTSTIMLHPFLGYKVDCNREIWIGNFPKIPRFHGYFFEQSNPNRHKHDNKNWSPTVRDFFVFELWNLRVTIEMWRSYPKNPPSLLLSPIARFQQTSRVFASVVFSFWWFWRQNELHRVTGDKRPVGLDCLVACQMKIGP